MIVAVHIATGKFVHFAGPEINVHDSMLFRNGPLPTAFDEIEDQEVSPKKGLADRGYYCTNPKDKLCQCLLTVVKKAPNGSLTADDKRMNQLISSLRIEVERGIGRLRNLHRLSQKWSSKGSLSQKLEKHAKLFKVAIHFTNYSMDLRPPRVITHWLLFMGPIPVKRAHRLIRKFMASPAGTHLNSVLSDKDVQLLAQFAPIEDEEMG